MMLKKYSKIIFISSLKHILLVITFFTFITVLMKLSVIIKIDSALPSGDARLYVYVIHFYKVSLSKLQFTLTIPTIYYPEGYGPPLSIGVLTFLLLAGSIALFTGLSEVATLNVFHLISIFLSGVSMYILLYYLTKNKYISLIGGLVYSSTPFLLIPTGWVSLIQLFWIPLIFLYVDKLTKSPNIKNSFLLAFFYSMQFFNSQEYTLYLTTILPIYILSKNVKILKNKNFIKFIILSFSFFLILSGWYINYHLKGNHEIRELDVNRENSLFNKIDIEFLHKPFILTLSIFGLFFILRMKLKKFYPFLIIGVLGLIFALGPFANFAPYTFLYKYWPYYNTFRTPYRMFVFTLIFISISTAILFRIFYIKSKFFFFILSMFLIIFLIMTTPQRTNYFKISSEEEKMYLNISLDTGNFSITEYPNIVSCKYVYHIIFHEKNLVGGCGSSPQTHKDFLNFCGIEILNLSNDSCRKKLIEFNTKYVIYHSEEYSEWNNTLNEITNSKYINFVGKYGNAYLFKLKTYETLE